jgi:hypothetical protein
MKMTRDDLKNLRVLVSDAALKKLVESPDFKDNFDVSTVRMIDRQKQALLSSNFELYSKLIAVEDLLEPYKSFVFRDNPKQIENYASIDKLSKRSYSIVMQGAKGHRFLKALGIDYARLDYDGWNSVLKRDNAQLDKIPEYLHTLGSTDLRKLFNTYPHLLKKITPDIAETLKLTAKQLVLLGNYGKLKKEKSLFTPETQLWIDMQLSIDVISGNAKITRQVKNAKNKS